MKIMLLQLKALGLIVLTMWLESPHDANASHINMPIDQAIIAANDSGDENGTRMELEALSRTEQWLSRQISAIKMKSNRTVVYHPNYWPNARVPYESFTLSPQEHYMLHKAFEQFHAYSCIRFRESTFDDFFDSVLFLTDWPCERIWIRGWPISVGSDCRQSFRDYLQVLSSAVGVGYEHQRPDRDDYITINASNVHRWNFRNFAKDSSEMFSGVPYNYLSIMHPSETVYSENGFPTIIAKNVSYQKIMGTSQNFTFGDVRRLNLMYQCAELRNCSQFIRCPGSGFVGQDCKCWCPQPDGSAPAMHCTECTDFEEMCPLLSEYGYCTNNTFEEYMKYTCPRSCSLCSPITPA